MLASAGTIDPQKGWMASPFPALGMLHPGWAEPGYARTQSPWPQNYFYGQRFGAVVEVPDYSGSRWPLTWPANQGVVHITSTTPEWPNPVAGCGEGYVNDGSNGLGLITTFGPSVGDHPAGTLMPHAAPATATLTKDGVELEICVQDEAGYVDDEEPQGHDAAIATLSDLHSVVVMPKELLTPGATYQLTVTWNPGVFGQRVSTRSFTVASTATPWDQPQGGITLGETPSQIAHDLGIAPDEVARLGTGPIGPTSTGVADRSQRTRASQQAARPVVNQSDSGAEPAPLPPESARR